MNDLSAVLHELTRIFRHASNKYEAHSRSQPLLAGLIGNKRILTQVLEKHLRASDVLNKRHYPVLSIEIELNPCYSLMANCWIPLPTGETDVATKAIHHHGKMLLTTHTVFGPGYEHWLFTPPKLMDAEQELFSMEVTKIVQPSDGHGAFVDVNVPHLPWYPASLTITLALFSNSTITTYKDYLKRIPFLKNKEAALRSLGGRLGLAKWLDLKMVRYFDFYPTPEGFKGMSQRKEYALGPNDDYLQSLFHILQQTGNEALLSLIEQRLASGQLVLNPGLVEKLAGDLKTQRPIQGKLSNCHLAIPHANFTKKDIDRTLVALRANKKEIHAG